MSKLELLIALTALFAIPIGAFGQKTQETLTPGGIVLFRGYVHTAEQGIDTQVGTISKAGGMTIRYDIGSPAGNHARPRSGYNKENVIWTKEQVRNGLTFIVTYSKGGQLAATFRETCANFMTSDATTDDLITDFILMITTYYSKPPDLRNVPRKESIFLRGC